MATLFGFKEEGGFISVPPAVREVPNAEFAN